MSFNRQGARLMKYSDSPDRKYRRVTSTSLACASSGGSPSPLSPTSSVAAARSRSSRSIKSETSAMPSGPCSALPLKMTSSISEPRRCFGLCSPSTQRMASTTFDFPHPLGPTMAVTPGGSSSTVRAMNDLKPFSSICLIRIRALSRPRFGRHTRVGNAHQALLRHQLRVPVRRIHRAQEGQPLLVASHAERLRHERRPLRAPRRPNEPHAGFRRAATALQAIAAMTRADHVLPHRGAALRARHDVIEIQLRAGESPATVLTAILVPRVDVEAAEPNVAARDAIVGDQEDDPRHPDDPVDQTDRILLRREVGPARKVEDAILLVHRSGDVLVQQRHRPPYRRVVDRQVRAVEDEDLGVQDRHSAGARTVHSGPTEVNAKPLQDARFGWRTSGNLGALARWRAPAQHGPAGSARLIEPRYAGLVRGLAHEGRLRPRFLGDA